MTVSTDSDEGDVCVAQFDKIRGFLAGAGSMGWEHSAVENYVRTEGFELLRLLLQDHFDQRAQNEARRDVTDATGVRFGAVESGHDRALSTVVGQVRVTRLAYRHRGAKNLYPADGVANLPDEQYSHGLRQLTAIEAARGSFDEAQDALERTTGVTVPKRQLESLAHAAAVDFDAFYATDQRPVAAPGAVIVISADGKGIVMRPDGLRPATAAKAAKTGTKLHGRLSKGEKRNHKRMAELGAVYTAAATQPRTPADIMGPRPDGTARPDPPTAQDKWLTASVVEDAAVVIAEVFNEAERRDPDHTRTWVGLVDGNNHQIDRILAEAAQRDITVTIIIDFVHVIEYVWSAAWNFFPEGDPEAEQWVHTKALQILEGKASTVAAAITRKATTLGLSPDQRHNADACAKYLLAKSRYLYYQDALTNGWPIATGIIEGACRHIVKDRFDITGARWSLDGAEAVLKLRALRANGDWDNYWQFHLNQEHTRVHNARYHTIPMAA